MKNLVVLLVLVLMSVISFGQTVNNIPVKEIDVEYVQIVGTSKMMSTKLIITIDFGQRTKMFASNVDETVVKDEQGKAVVFNSMIDALNFMSQNGFEFVNAYVITVGNQNVYHYVLRKRKI